MLLAQNPSYVLSPETIVNCYKILFDYNEKVGLNYGKQVSENARMRRNCFLVNYKSRKFEPGLRNPLRVLPLV